MMESFDTNKLHQLEGLLSRNIRNWALARLPQGVDIADVTFGDFINIQPSVLFEYLLESPRQTDGFWEAQSAKALPKNDVNGRVIVLRKNRECWVTYNSGISQIAADTEVFATRDEALDRAASKIWRSALILMNASFCAKRQIAAIDSVGTAPSSFFTFDRF